MTDDGCPLACNQCEAHPDSDQLARSIDRVAADCTSTLVATLFFFSRPRSRQPIEVDKPDAEELPMEF